MDLNYITVNDAMFETKLESNATISVYTVEICKKSSITVLTLT